MNLKIVKRICLSLLTLAVFIIASCSVLQSGDGKKVNENLKIMAYNIHHANPPSKPDIIDIEAIVNVIRKENPDVVALQEVDVYTERSGPINQAKEIARQLGMNYFFGRAIDYEGGEYGVAILSKYPLSKTINHSLPTEEGTNGEPRVLATAIITTPDGNEVIVGSTHLDAQKESTNRLLQIHKIVKLAEDEEKPLIIAGDFNAVPGSEVINMLDNYFERTCEDCPLTSSAQNPVRTIDFIAFRPNEYFKIIKHKVIEEVYASDHFPVVAEIMLTPSVD